MVESIERHFEKDGEKEQLIQNAMRLYYHSVIKDGFIEMRSSSKENNGNNGNSGNNGNLAVKPRWEYSIIEQNNTHQAVEIILEMDKAFNTVTPETDEEYRKSRKKEYLRSKTSLIYLTEKKTGATNIFLMTIVPDLSYLVSAKFDPFKKMSYLKRDNKFEGLIYYHNLKGEFVNGWVYKEGKVVATMEALSKKPDFELRSGGCTTYYSITYVEQCWNTGNPESGTPTFSNCYTYIEDYYFYTICDYSDGGGGGGYGEGDPFGDPTLPDNPCISGIVGKSKNTNMLADKTIRNEMDTVLKGKLKDANEWAVSIGKNSSGTTYYVTPPKNMGPTGGSPVSDVPSGYVFVSYGHSHRDGIGVPSPHDLYEFLEGVIKNPSLESMYVYGIGIDGAIETYAINVNNRAAVEAFLKLHPKNSNLGFAGFTNDLLLEYEDAKNAYTSGHYNYQAGQYQYIREAFALSYIMSIFNMGVSLTRKVDNGPFQIINTQKVSDVVYNITTCQ